MGVNNKLVQLGWIDAQGRSLLWTHWQEKRNRVPVAYWSDGIGRPKPIYMAGLYKKEKGGKL
jgi:hypothetical protein